MRSIAGRERLLVWGLGVTLAAVSLFWFSEIEELDLDGDIQLVTAGVGIAPRIELELLQLNAAAFDSGGRNLFAYHTIKVPPPQEVKSEAQETRTTRVVVPPTTVGERPETRPVPPRPEFAYIGHLGPKNDLIAVFQKDSQTLVARVGDIVDSGYELVGFRYQAVMLERVSGAFEGDVFSLEQQPR